jgi:hypothetical protein
MKRGFIFLLFIMIPTVSLAAMDLSLGIYGGYFIPSDQNFKDIYGNSFRYGCEFDWKFSRYFSLRAGAGYQSTTGELTFSGEETSLRIIPVDLGLRFRIPIKRFVPYIGGAAGIYIYREENPIGKLNDTALGFVGEAGFLLQVTSKFDLDFRFKYDHFQAKPTDLEANLGGIHALVGIRYLF